MFAIIYIGSNTTCERMCSSFHLLGEWRLSLEVMNALLDSLETVYGVKTESR